LLSFEINSRHPKIEEAHHADVVGFSDVMNGWEDQGEEATGVRRSKRIAGQRTVSLGDESELTSVAGGEKRLSSVISLGTSLTFYSWTT
jgi:hypothetical protein